MHSMTFHDKPGCDWLDQDFQSFFAWLNSRKTRNGLLRSAAAYAQAVYRYRVDSQDLLVIWDQMLDQIYSVRKHYDPEKGRLSTYLQRIIKNRTARVVREKMRLEPLEDASEQGFEIHPEIARHEAGLSPERQRALRITFAGLLARLEQQADEQDNAVTRRRLGVVRKHYFEDKRVAEISREERLTEATVKKDLREGRALLRRELEN